MSSRCPSVTSNVSGSPSASTTRCAVYRVDKAPSGLVATLLDLDPMEPSALMFR